MHQNTSLTDPLFIRGMYLLCCGFVTQFVRMYCMYLRSQQICTLCTNLLSKITIHVIDTHFAFQENTYNCFNNQEVQYELS